MATEGLCMDQVIDLAGVGNVLMGNSAFISFPVVFILFLL